MFGSNCQNFNFCAQGICKNGAACYLSGVQVNFLPSSQLNRIFLQYSTERGGDVLNAMSVFFNENVINYKLEDNNNNASLLVIIKLNA